MEAKKLQNNLEILYATTDWHAVQKELGIEAGIEVKAGIRTILVKVNKNIKEEQTDECK